MTTPGTNLSTIQHVVVLMLENRSFDHMLGFLYSGSDNVSPACSSVRRADRDRGQFAQLRVAGHRVQDRAEHAERVPHAGCRPR